MNKCECYFEQEVINPCEYGTKIIGHCNGTKERDECQCEGDLSKCDFYPIRYLMKISEKCWNDKT